MPTRSLPSIPHRRLAGFVLLSALMHALLWGLPPSPNPNTLSIPANELAVAFPAQPHRASAIQRKPGSVTVRRETAVVDSPAPESAPVEPATASASDAVTNHLHSLMQDTVKRYFVYPPMARRLGWEGRVELAVQLDPEGRLYGLRVLHSSGYALLDDDALQTLQRIGSIPQARAWLPRQGYATTLPVVYRLREG